MLEKGKKGVKDSCIAANGDTREGKEGKREVYKAIDVTKDVPTGRLRLLHIHEIPEVLHQVHVNALGHAGQDETVAEVMTLIRSL